MDTILQILNQKILSLVLLVKMRIMISVHHRYDGNDGKNGNDAHETLANVLREILLLFRFTYLGNDVLVKVL